MCRVGFRRSSTVHNASLRPGLSKEGGCRGSGVLLVNGEQLLFRTGAGLTKVLDAQRRPRSMLASAEANQLLIGGVMLTMAGKVLSGFPQFWLDELLV